MNKLSLIFVLVLILLFVFDHQKINTQNKKNDKATHAAEYYAYRRLSRANENGHIPMDGLLLAKQHIQDMSSARDAGLWEWEWLGPSNIGGRIRTILPNPDNSNILWIGSAGGGIWKTTNGGSSWTAINDFMTSLAVTSMVFDPSTTNIMYAATGEGFGNSSALPGAGILKSTDGGSSWNQLVSTNNNNFTYVNRLAAHPNPDSAGILYAVTSEINGEGTNEIWKTTDGGVSWIPKLNVGNRALDVKIDPNDHNEIMVGGKGFVYLSDDYGETWTEQSTGALNKLPNTNGRYEVSFCKSNHNKIYVSLDQQSGQVWRSIDNGSTWNLRNTGTNYFGTPPKTQGWYDNALWVCPTNSERIVVGGIDLFRSTNGGTDLTRISDWVDYHNGGSANSAHADQHTIVHAADFDITTNPVVYFGNDGGIQKTEDIWTVTENSGWVNLANSLGITQFFGGAAADDGSIIVGGAQDNDKIRYRESGAWSGADNWYQAHTGDGGYAAIDNSNTDIIYGSFIYLSIKKSIDAGDTYFNSYSGIADQGSSNTSLFINPLSMDPNDPSVLVTGGDHIWRTINNADDWVEIRDNLAPISYCCSAIDIDDGNSAVIWVGYENGHVAKTISTGDDWDRVDNNGIGLPDRYVTDIAINPNNSNQVFVTFGGYENDNVWFTDDGGDSWQNRSGTAPNNLPALQVNTVRFHPANGNWVYIGTDLGVFASVDKGQNWSVTTNGSYGGTNEGPVNTEVSELIWQGNEFLIAVTHGRGMYRSAGPPYKIYVDGAAAAGGNGSQSQPFQTVAEAVNVAGPGAFIYIEAGTYDESEIITFQNQGLIFVMNGSVLIK